jgi:hypothetical protein
MSIDDLNMFDGLRIPRDGNDVPAALLVGLIDKLGGGHYKAVAIDPDTGELGTSAKSFITIKSPNFVLMHDHIKPANATAILPSSPIGYAASGCSQLIVDIVIIDPSSYVTLEPIVWNPLFGQYIGGEDSGRITKTQRFVLDIQSPDDIYLLPIEVFGTVSIAVAGI